MDAPLDVIWRGSRMYQTTFSGLRFAKPRDRLTVAARLLRGQYRLCTALSALRPWRRFAGIGEAISDARSQKTVWRRSDHDVIYRNGYPSRGSRSSALLVFCSRSAVYFNFHLERGACR